PGWVGRLVAVFFLALFLGVLTIGLWLPPIIIHATVKDYHFPKVTIDATVEPDGDLVLEERRTFDFRNGDFTYAYFQVDDPQDHVREFTIHEIVGGREIPVEPDYAFHTITIDGFQAQWSYVANDEERTWVFRYRVACAVDVWSDTAHLNWQFIGTGWGKPTSHAVITVHLPGSFATQAARPAACDPDTEPPPLGDTEPAPLDRSEVRAWGHGPLNGQVTIVDPQTIRYEVRDVPPASYVEGSIVFPTEAVPAAPQVNKPRLKRILAQERGWAEQANAIRRQHESQRRWLFILLLALPIAMVLLVLLAKARDRIPEVPGLLEQPPEPDAVQGSLLWSAWRGHLSPQNAYRAQVLRLVQLGAIEMRAEGMVTDPKDLTLHKRMEALELPTKADQDFQMLLFGTGKRAVDEISILKPKPQSAGGQTYTRYRAWWDGAKARTGDALTRIQKGDARLESTTAFVLAGGAAGYGIWTAVWGLGGLVGWWLVPAAVAYLVPALIAIPARVDRPLRERMAKLAAFRRYLQHFSDLPNAPALAVVIWEKYLEWAVALGVADEVEKQVRALIPVEQLPSPVPGGPSGLHGVSVFRAMNAAAPTLVMHSMASARSGSRSGGFGSSSSHGGGGGGFSGGGGGGGGGTGGGAG
ncbi:MAG: DUF2207 domain-containing protein, partial [Actinomycetota bacterium]